MLIGAYSVLCLVGLISALAIVAAQTHPVHRIAFLVVVFLVTSLEFIILDFTFLGLTQIIVYCGAIAIIFLFVIMMVARPDLQPVQPVNLVIVVLVVLGIVVFFQSKYSEISHQNVNLVNQLHQTNWSSEFILLTDLHLFACMVYIAYPTAQIQISIALWIVMIAIIKLTVTSNQE